MYSLAPVRVPKGSRKKRSSLNGRAIKRGGGLKGGPLRKKEVFLELLLKKFVAI